MKRLLGCTMVRYDCQRPIYLCGVPRRCLVSAQEEECRGRAIMFRDLYTLRFFMLSQRPPASDFMTQSEMTMFALNMHDPKE